MLIRPLWEFFWGTWYTASVPDLHDGSIDSFAFGVKNLKIWPFLFFCHFRDILDTYQSSQKFTWPFSMTALVRSLSSSSGASVWFFGANGCAQFFWWHKIYTLTSKKGPSMSFVVYSPQLDRPYFDGLFLGCCGFDAVDISCKFFAHIIIGEGMRSICKISNIVSPQCFLQNVMSLLYTVLFIF